MSGSTSETPVHTRGLAPTRRAAALFSILKSKRPLRSWYLLGGGALYAAFIAAAVVTIVS